METFRTVTSTCMVFAIFILDLSSSDIQLTIHNTSGSSTDLTCGSKVVFMCNMNKLPTFYLEWVLDGSTVSSCTSKCTPATDAPGHYNFSRNSKGTEYYLTIDPLKIDDSKSIVCQDGGGNKSQTIEAKVEPRYLKDNSTLEVAEDNIAVTVTFTTNCMPSQTNVVTKFKCRKKDSNKDFFEYTEGTPIVKYLECTNADNPYCGGNATMRRNTTLNIQKSDDGVPYTFVLEVEENSILDQRQIGSFKIKDIPDTTTHSINTGTTSTGNAKCNSNQTLCDATKLCVNKCDDIKDCSDGSDEENCNQRGWVWICFNSSGYTCVLAAGGTVADSYRGKKKADRQSARDNERTEDV